MTLPNRLRFVARGGVAGALLLSVIAGAATAAEVRARHVPVSGTVVCARGRSVVGIRLQYWGGAGGGETLSGWRRMPGSHNVAQYKVWVANRSTISVHVLCAGTRPGRPSDSRTARIEVHRGEVVNAVCRRPTKRGAVRCRLPRIGLVAPDHRNHFDAGWCTWGAATMLYRATGQYPGWFGNAKDWARSARGWVVTSEPMAHSIFVYPGGLHSSPSGHVGWVDRVEYSRHGVFLHTTEMNGWPGGLYRWSHERTRYDRSMRFILVP